eukprot:Gregarina_sp_Pseudo_9__278@NODE_1179_length_1811_cov_87_950339_g1105_i0_p1_GENE_NODE_1179_length_1811_cov_87_950339_g1105_i0NODE_1179_length_1811_cov_87_950339_g1105_i0_p1_ORF_typecomplete_len535_score181_80Fbox/PF00646_33/0_0013Fbox/PF00646_33/8_9e03_NODE_1179_length_1811_cov_87_950339_g1105_i01661770
MWRAVYFLVGEKITSATHRSFKNERLPPTQRYTLCGDELSALLEFLSLPQVLRLRSVSRSFRRFIDEVWVCRTMELSPRFLAAVSCGKDDCFAQRAIDFISTKEQQPSQGDGDAKRRQGDGDANHARAGDGDTKQEETQQHKHYKHYMLGIYKRSVASLKSLKWIPGEAAVHLCPLCQCVPKYKVVAPNLDGILRLSRGTLERLELRSCYMSPSPMSEWLRYTALRFPRLHTLIHTTQGFAKGASYSTDLGFAECPKLRHVELSVDIPRSCVSELCDRVYRAIQHPWNAALPLDVPLSPSPSPPARLYSMADYGVTTCRAFGALVLQSLEGGVDCVDLANVWGVPVLMMLACLHKLAVSATPSAAPRLAKFTVHRIFVSELPSDMVHALWLLDHLTPHLQPVLSPSCRLRIHVIPVSQTPLALGRNIANQSLGGDVEDILLRLTQRLLFCDEDAAQHAINQWKLRHKIDIFAGSMTQPRLRRMPTNSSFKHLHKFSPISLTVACLPDPDDCLKNLPSFKRPPILTSTPCAPESS